MAEEYIYNGKPLSSLDLWALGLLGRHLEEAEAKREKARKHPKFEKMNFPDANPEFVKLKNAVKEEIRKKQNGIS
jgi:hypothetical protein